jgi:putative redox protein
MQLELNWKDGMAFEAKAGSNLISMDAKTPIGRNTAATPKELLAAALAGCTAMDVIALMRKHKQEVTHFSIKTEISTNEKAHPAVFTAVKLNFYLEGQVDPAKALQAVQLSQTQYCGVSAMLSQAFPINWELFVNGASIGTGEASF